MRRLATLRTMMGQDHDLLLAAAIVLLVFAGQCDVALAEVVVQDTRSSAIIRVIPTLSSGSPGLVLERAEYGVLAPSLSGQLFLEIPQILGRGRRQMAFAYSYAQLDRTDGDVPDARNKDGVLVRHPLDAAHIFYLAGTLGLTDRLDFNLAIPATFQDYAGGERLPLHDELVVDPIIFRLKRLLSNPDTANAADFAGGLGFSIRTDQGAYGDPPDHDRFVLSPALFASVQRLGEYSLRWIAPVPLRPYFNVGFDITPLDVRFSDFHWGAGMDAQLIPERLTMGFAFLGKDELASVKGEIDDFTFDGERVTRKSVNPRRDFFDFSFGGRLILWSNLSNEDPHSFENPQSLMLFANVLVAMNNDGLRAPAIPTVGIEYVF
jgi:hypothetical protein